MYNIVHKMNKGIYGNGKEKILECFYLNRNKEIYFSEILRQTNLTQNTTLKHLKSLVDNGIINTTKKIANTFYNVNPKNPLIYSIFSYFDYKRFNGLPFIRKRAISEFLEKIDKKPLIAFIFGSTAKGTFSKESDIDVILIYNKREKEQEKLKEDIEAITGTKIQTFIFEYDYFKEQMKKQEDNLLMSAVKTGFVMEGHSYFYKEVLR